MSASSLTFASLLTPPGKGGIAVLCLRGPGTADVLKRLFRPLPSHVASGTDRLQLGRLVSGDRILDEAVVHQRGDWAEVNIHGGPAVARAVLEAMVHCGAKIEPADAGGDALPPQAASTWDDLPPAHPRWNNPAVGRELLAVLPGAASAAVVAALTLQWSAGISELARGALESLRDSSFDVRYSTSLRQAAEGLAVMRRLLEPAEVVLAGPPNAGKSTLANALVGRPISIVHQTPGTTRDWVRELALLGGLPAWITDTAGPWEDETSWPLAGPEVEIERQAARRALERIAQAEIVLLLGQPPAPPPGGLSGRAKVIPIWAKCDSSPPRPGRGRAGERPYLAVSAKTGEGMDRLKQAILQALGLEGFDPALPRAFTPRQASLLASAAEEMDRRDASSAGHAMRRLLEG